MKAIQVSRSNGEIKTLNDLSNLNIRGGEIEWLATVVARVARV